LITLRELRIEDVEKMYEFIENEETASNFIFTRYPFSKEKLNDFVIKSWSDSKNVHYAILAENGEYAGTVSLKGINYVDRNAEYAIVLRKEFWGKNVAYEATRKIIDYAFNRLNLNKVYLNVLASNKRANKFYEKFGFEFEGVFKKHLFVGGEYIDLNWYCIVKDSYKNKE
jgi:RimJ/RimL family protein N-acetyltransferase